MIAVSPTSPAELPAASRLLFAGPDANLRAERFAALVTSGEIDLGGLLLAKRDGEPVGLVVVQYLPGGSAVVIPPAPHFGEASDALAAAVVTHLRAHPAALANVFLSDADAAQADPLLRHGFRSATAVVHMVRDLKHLPPLPVELTFDPADAEPVFGETLLATYAGSLDVPEANTPRTAEQILAGYRGEQPGPPHWWLARTPAGDPVGVVILIAPRHQPAWELGYLGVIPSARGNGYGAVLLRFALHACRYLGGDHLSLSVDTRNEPALAVYQRYGFQQYQEQRVFLWRSDW